MFDGSLAADDGRRVLVLVQVGSVQLVDEVLVPLPLSARLVLIRDECVGFVSLVRFGRLVWLVFVRPFGLTLVLEFFYRLLELLVQLVHQAA